MHESFLFISVEQIANQFPKELLLIIVFERQQSCRQTAGSLGL